MSAMDAVQGTRVRVVDRTRRRLGKTLAEAIAPHQEKIVRFADSARPHFSTELADLWAKIFPMVVPPNEPEGLGIILFNSNADTHFSFTNALGMISAEQIEAFNIVQEQYPEACWLIGLHHHLVEYPWAAKALSERIGTALINGNWVLRQLKPLAGRAILMFEGAGISYWASPVEAKLCEGEEVALIGGGNSAGQATVFLAPKVKRLHLVVRGDGLEASMSRYLIDRIKALPNVELHTKTEIVALEGDQVTGLTGAVFRCKTTGETHTCPLRHIFLFIGAEPNANWLEQCVDVDGKGFVITGSKFADGNGAIGRPPLPLETSKPHVFAVGDVRAGSTKRVAAAVGEGAAVVAQIHSALGD